MVVPLNPCWREIQISWFPKIQVVSLLSNKTRPHKNLHQKANLNPKEKNKGKEHRQVYQYLCQILLVVLCSNWTLADLEKIKIFTRSLLTTYCLHHLISAVVRATHPRKYGGSGLMDISALHNK